MPKVEKMRAFIIKFVFYTIIIGLFYVVLKFAMPFLMPFVFGFAIAFLLNPLINKITDKTKLKRKPVSILMIIVFYIVAASLITILGSRLVLFCRDMFYTLPQFYEDTIAPALYTFQEKLTAFINQINPSLVEFINLSNTDFSSNLSSLVSSVSGYAIAAVTNTATKVPLFVISFILTIIVSFFCVADYNKITGFITRQMPDKAKNMLLKVKASGIDVVFKFARAYAILLGITFIELSLGLTLLGVPNSILIAFVIALVDILPILGSGTVLIPWGLFQLLVGDYAFGAGILIMYAIIALVRQTLEPRVVGKQIGLYPLVTLACMFIGAQLFGFIGLFGLPIIVTIIVQLNKSEGFEIFK